MVSLIIQSFGRENEYKRAILTVISFYAHTSLPIERTKVILFTDKPSYFKDYLQGLPIEFMVLTDEKIKRMRGQIDFLHRMKIALIEESFEVSDGNLFYVDSDTFFTGDPKPILELVSESTASMHLLEYPFEKNVEDKTDTYQAFYRLINSRKFTLADGSVIDVTNKHSSWNAGVMVFHPTHKKFIPDVYALTEQFYPGSGSHASEQYAFSVVLQTNLHLEPCDHLVYHYWYRVKKQIVDQFLDKRLTQTWALFPLDQKLADIKSWTAQLPGHLEKHVWMTRDRAIQAFNNNRFYEGYCQAVKAFLQKPLDSSGLLKDTFYHLKRQIAQKEHAG